METLDNGVIEYFDADDQLCKVTIPPTQTYQLEADPDHALQYLSAASELTVWIHEGRPHRDPDADGQVGPAVSCQDYQMWFRHGRRHRDPGAGPAIIYTDGSRHTEYWVDGVRHRPADADGTELPAVSREKESRLEWWRHGLLHREVGPAVIDMEAGQREWYHHGQLHRCPDADGTEMPAVENDSGYQAFFIDGEYHRDRGPAIITENWREVFYQHGVVHRLDGPAVIDPENNAKEWWCHGRRHRDPDKNGITGPALEYGDGSLEWYRHGQLHRQDGPAQEYADGREEYWLDDQWYPGIEAWEQAKLVQAGKTENMLG